MCVAGLTGTCINTLRIQVCQVLRWVPVLATSEEPHSVSLRAELPVLHYGGATAEMFVLSLFVTGPKLRSA